MKIVTKYNGNMRFRTDGIHPVVMDAVKNAGGRAEAPSPKEMILYGLAGCTGMDVVYILNKRKIPFAGLDITVEAELTEYHPKTFDYIRVIFRINADTVYKREFERAIALSSEDLCGATAMLRKSAKIEHELIIVSDLKKPE